MLDETPRTSTRRTTTDDFLVSSSDVAESYEVGGKWRRKAQNNVAVVFVHGILSNTDVWKSAETSWPDLLCSEPEVSEAGVYVFSYRADVWSGNYTLGDAVESLHAYVTVDRLLEHGDLVFVCHSMGGILVRQWIVTRQASLIERKTRIGLFLVASPSLGSDYANMLVRLARVVGNTQARALRFSDENTWLNDLDRNFINLKESGRLHLIGKEIVEDAFVVLPSVFTKQVVAPFSGARYFGDSVKIPFSDHFSIAKPRSQDALQHRLLLEFLLTAFLVRQRGTEPEVRVAWPQTVDFTPNIADRAENEWPAILQLLSGGTPQRILLLQGESGIGKSDLLVQARRYAEQVGIPVFHVNFKVHTERDKVLEHFRGVFAHSFPNLSRERLNTSLLGDLRTLRRPVLITLDAYEFAAENTPLADWVNEALLQEVARCPAIAVIVAGQRVPNPDASWRDLQRHLRLRAIRDGDAWKQWVSKQYPALDADTVVPIVLQLTKGVPLTAVTYIECFVEAREIIQQQEAGDDNIYNQAAIAAECLVSNTLQHTKEEMRAAVDAGSLLRWFDANLLGQVLGLTENEAVRHFTLLSNLPFVETYISAERDFRSVHDATRLGWRRRMASHNSARFRTLSWRAATYFTGRAYDDRIERIYHLLCGEPDRGVDELAELHRDIRVHEEIEVAYKLAVVLTELRVHQLLSDRADLWGRLASCWARVFDADAARLLHTAKDLLRRARDLNDWPAAAQAQFLLGEAYEERLSLQDAHTAFQECVNSNRELRRREPANLNWQQDLAMAHSRLGQILEARGDLEAARHASDEYQKVFSSLVECGPENADWWLELGSAHLRMGSLLERIERTIAESYYLEAEAAFSEALRIYRGRAGRESDNAGWQRQMAKAHKLIGSALEAQRKLPDAEVEFRSYLTICQRMAGQDPRNGDWQRSLAEAHSLLGGVLWAQELDGVLAEFTNSLAISQRLFEKDSRNARSRYTLSRAHLRLGDVLAARGRYSDADQQFGQALALTRELLEHDTTSALWLRYSAAVLDRMGNLYIEWNKMPEAKAVFAQSVDISRKVLKLDATNVIWRRDLATAYRRLADLLMKEGADEEAQSALAESERIVQNPPEQREL